MSALSVALSAVVLMAGLLIASAIMAVETSDPVPVAQMNRVHYPAIAVAVPSGGPVLRPVRHRTKAPVAQMNRVRYQR